MAFDAAPWRGKLAVVLRRVEAVHSTGVESEQKFAAATSRMNFSLLFDAFLGFFGETIAHADAPEWRGRWNEFRDYASVLWEHGVVLRQLRAARLVASGGYPLQAVTLLRDVKDKALTFCALAHRLHSLDEWLGEPQGPAGAAQDLVDRARAKRAAARLRSQHQARVFDQLVGEQSGLPSRVQDLVRAWMGLFHDEVHGAKLTSTVGFPAWAAGRSLLPLYCTIEESRHAVTLYHTYGCQLAWMMLRLLPTLQLDRLAFGAEWAQYWSILDSSCRELVLAGKGDEEHEVIDAVVEFVESKFAFSPMSTRYAEEA